MLPGLVERGCPELVEVGRLTPLWPVLEQLFARQILGCYHGMVIRRPTVECA
ncbi:hypothetical protein [Micromonospora sp. MH33]|uniref:hypothetical protein n=1 Tax=Micromonospora sp. MH33 TaxID=1945509 RepID=UPI00143D4A95|nr:hypothetical protein [Micromonospora sp. MH33]